MKAESRIPNIRISPHAHAVLRRLAREEDNSMQSVLDKAIEHYRREKFLQDANSDFDSLKRKPKAWKAMLRERNIWERASADGLDDA